MLTNEILSSIDNIDDCIMEAEMNVINAMINEYDKAIMIMENYNGNDYSSFDIFQEGFKDDIGTAFKGVDKNGKKERILKRIIMFIPRLIQAFINMLKNKWNNRKSQQHIKKIEELENTIKDLKGEMNSKLRDMDTRHEQAAYRSAKLQDDINKLTDKVDASNNRITDVESSLNNRIDSTRRHVAKNKRDIHFSNKMHDRKMENVEDSVRYLNGDVESLKTLIDVRSGIIIPEFPVPLVSEYYDGIIKIVDKLKKISFMDRYSSTGLNELQTIAGEYYRIYDTYQKEYSDWTIDHKRKTITIDAYKKMVKDIGLKHTALIKSSTEFMRHIEKTAPDFSESTTVNGSEYLNWEEVGPAMYNLLKEITNDMKSIIYNFEWQIKSCNDTIDEIIKSSNPDYK